MDHGLDLAGDSSAFFFPVNSNSAEGNNLLCALWCTHMMHYANNDIGTSPSFRNKSELGNVKHVTLFKIKSIYNVYH